MVRDSLCALAAVCGALALIIFASLSLQLIGSTFGVYVPEEGAMERGTKYFFVISFLSAVFFGLSRATTKNPSRSCGRDLNLEFYK